MEWLKEWAEVINLIIVIGLLIANRGNGNI